MLASTVQFSNNDQPPVTACRSRPSPGPAPEESSFPQTPNSVPDTTGRPDQRSTPRRAVLAPGPSRTVPSSQRSTHEQPVRDARSQAGPWPRPEGLGKKCSLERR
jgi:hypothetical protein